MSGSCRCSLRACQSPNAIRRLLMPSRTADAHFRSASTAAKMQNRLPAAYYRGGTSRAIIFRQTDLPENRKEWEPIFCGALGSPDPNGRQLDGLGGGISSLSKICVVGPSTHPEADVDYTFAAIGVKDMDVDYSSNCGNMASAIGPFAVDSGMVGAKEDGEVTVRIHNTNTGKIIHATFPVVQGEAAAEGPFAIDGVTGTAAKVELAFVKPEYIARSTFRRNHTHILQWLKDWEAFTDG
jgi:2-methylaconitate cis-trans-isomerase PrpF